jgi:hypothetical protein
MGMLQAHQRGLGATRMQNESSGPQIIRFSTFELDVRAVQRELRDIPGDVGAQAISI